MDEIIADLGLTGARDTPVGNWAIRGLSGGQRRRLSIGCELVLSPVRPAALVLLPPDAPEAWQLGSQDPATLVMQGIIDLHHFI